MTLGDKLRSLSPKIKHLDTLGGIFTLGSIAGLLWLFGSGISYAGYSQKLQEIRKSDKSQCKEIANINYLKNQIEKSKKNAKRSFYFLIPSVLLLKYFEDRDEKCKGLAGINNKHNYDWEIERIWENIKDIPVEQYLHDMNH